MKSKRSLRSFSNTLTAAGLVLAVSACSTVYKDDWNQASDVPNLNEPMQRSQALLDYCKRLHSRGDLNLAAGICNRAHEINPTDPAPLIELARVLEELEVTESAVEAYRAALLLDPEQTDALYGLGKIYIDQQRYDLAMEPLEAAAQQPTDDPRIYNALGVIMDQQGQHADAQAYYRQGLEHSPRNVSLRNNLGLSMVLDGQPEAGLAMLRDVAAEPAAGATTGRNLEMASQMAAKSAAAKPAAGMSAAESADAKPQMSKAQPMPQTGRLWPTEELATLAPSSAGVDTPEASASEPMPLLDPYARHQTDETAQATMPNSTPRHARSLDYELADAMADDAAAAPAHAPTAETQAQPAAPQQTAALPAADPAADDVSGIPRDWSLAAQTVFAQSRVAVPEPSQITVQERAGADDAFHEIPAPEASPQIAPKPTTTAHADLAMTPASTPETAATTTATAEAYPVDEDTFYTAQLASFRTAERAREGWQILENSAGGLLEGSDAYIVRADLGAEMGTYYRVRAGTMTDRAAAAQFCQDLQAQGVDCMPVEASWQETNEALVDKICRTGSTAAMCTTQKRSDLERNLGPHARG
jgi:Flp pilus assembly protein TadD